MNCPLRQRGLALVLSIVILLIMTITGVALVRGTILQERMSGNLKLQALAFEAASAGIAEARIFGLSRAESGERANWPAGSSCRRGTGGADPDLWSSGWSGWLPHADVGGDAEAEYRLLVYCVQDRAFRAAVFLDESDPEAKRLPPQLFVVAEGRAPVGQGAGRALRQLEVRVEDPQLDPGDVDPAIRIEGDSIEFLTANSNRFIVDGDGGPAIATSDGSDRTYIIDQIENTGPGRMGNYLGVGETEDSPPIVAGEGRYPFSSPQELWTFVTELKDNISTAAEAGGASYSGDTSSGTCGFNWVPENLLGGGNVPQCSASNPATNLADIDFNADQLTYVTGDAVIGGSSSGSGIIIVEGSVCFHGNADFKGQIIALGGVYDMRGGGNGETLGGIFVGDIDVSDGSLIAESWGNTLMDFRGGGNHTVAYDCQGVLDIWEGLHGCGLAPDWESHECEDDGGRAIGSGLQNRMIGWRENLGWRETAVIDDQGNIIIIEDEADD